MANGARSMSNVLKRIKLILLFFKTKELEEKVEECHEIAFTFSIKILWMVTNAKEKNDFKL